MNWVCMHACLFPSLLSFLDFHSTEIEFPPTGKTLGEGAFSKVKRAVHKVTGELVAIKILEKEKIIDV